MLLQKFHVNSVRFEVIFEQCQFRHSHFVGMSDIFLLRATVPISGWSQSSHNHCKAMDCGLDWHTKSRLRDTATRS